MNTDIDTTQITDAPVITDLKGLSDTIHEMAKEQLKVNEAEAKMQAAVEDAKKQYEAAISPHTGLIATLFTSVASYAKQAIDTLFPQSKNGKRKKTYTILGHQLQLRSSSSITAPEDIILDLLNLANQRRIDSATLFATPDADHAYAEQLRAEAVKFESLIRTPAPELNKEAATELLKDPDIGPTLEAYGIKSETTDTFKVAFKFTPESTKP